MVWRASSICSCKWRSFWAHPMNSLTVTVLDSFCVTGVLKCCVIFVEIYKKRWYLLYLLHTSCPVVFRSVLWHCWLDDKKGIRPVKKLGVGFVGADDLTGAIRRTKVRLIAPVLTTSITFSSNKIQNAGVWPLKRRVLVSFGFGVRWPELGRFYSRGVPLSFPIVTVNRSLNLATETKDVGEKNKSGTHRFL